MTRRSLLLLVLPFSLVALSLGLWQWQRLAWKESLLAQIAERCHRETALSLPSDWEKQNIDTWVWQRVRLSGFWTEKTASLWRGGQWHEIRALKLDKGFIFVERHAKAPPIIKGRVPVEAVLYPSMPPRFFDPESAIAERRWFRRDVNEMATALDIAPVFGLIADSSLTCPNPRNQHFNYMVTWFFLMLLLPFVALMGKTSATKEERDT